MPDQSVYHTDISLGMSRDTNVNGFNFDRNMSRNPESVITIFTTNTRELYSASGRVKFPGRDKNERFRKVASLTDPKYYTDNLSIEGGKDSRHTTTDDGKWVAMDWLNPQNIFNLDQDFVVPEAVNDGTNLLQRGMFFIVRPFDPVRGNVHDEPTEDEIAGGEKRLRARYTELDRLYQLTSTATPAKLPEIMSEEMIDALNYAKRKTPYNTVLQAMTECPTCGETKAVNAKFHKSESLGVVCIEPSVEGWKAAVAAGIKKRDEVPDEFKWLGRTANAT